MTSVQALMSPRLVGAVLLAVCWLRCADGYVAGCTWHAYIVNTSDVAKHDAPVIHDALPRPPFVDVTEHVRKLAITGIKVDEEVGEAITSELASPVIMPPPLIGGGIKQ